MHRAIQPWERTAINTAMDTLPPAPENVSAISFPRPLAAPITTATQPLNPATYSVISSSLFHRPFRFEKHIHVKSSFSLECMHILQNLPNRPPLTLSRGGSGSLFICASLHDRDRLGFVSGTVPFP